ncbi:zinc ribbon domain-containing protein [Aerococcaceae bacterium DSM 111176]|nr:zinc ribbon domain-containing protein [Aerococcaceae bacterium DSM 111176]
MSFCPNCGERFLEGARFCIECGREATIISDSDTNIVDLENIEEQLTDPVLITEDSLEEENESSEINDSVEIDEVSKSTENKQITHDMTQDASEQKKSSATTIKKTPFILMGIILLLGGLAFFVWNSSSKNPEVWRTNPMEGYPFAINTTIDKNRYLAEVKPEMTEYMDPYLLNNKVIIEGDIVPTNNPNSQQIKIDTVSLELNDFIVSEAFNELLYEYTNESPTYEFIENFISSWSSEPMDQKKVLLSQFVTNYFESFQSEPGDAINPIQSSALTEIESYVHEIIDTAYEVEGGLGIKITPLKLKDLVTLLATIDDTFYYDSQEIVAVLNAIESNLTFDLTNETSASISIPFTNKRLFFKKEMDYR